MSYHVLFAIFEESHLQFEAVYPTLLLILSTHKRHSAMLELLLKVLVHRECHSLTRRDTHYAGRDTFVEGVEALLSADPMSVLLLA